LRNILGALFRPKIPVLPYVILHENPRGTWHFLWSIFLFLFAEVKKHLLLLVWRSTAIADVSPLVLGSVAVFACSVLFGPRKLHHYSL